MAKVEIEIDSEESCDCCADCKMGSGMKMAGPARSKDDMLAELKKLLMVTGSNGLAERQMKIDELISEIEDLGD